MATLEQPQQPPPETAPGVVEQQQQQQQQQQNGTTSNTSNIEDEKPQTKRSNSGSFRPKPDNTNNKDLVYEITNYDVLFAPDDSSDDNSNTINTGDLHDSIKTLPIQNKSTVRFASTAANHVGNNRFEVFLNMHRDSFQKAELAKNNKLQDEIIDKIINIITKQCDPQGRFLVQKEGVDGRASWINIGEGYEAKEKIKGALRLSKIPVAPPPPSAPQKETNDRRKSNDTEPASGSRNNSMHSVDISSMGGPTGGDNNNNNNTSLEVEEILVNDDSEDEQDEHTGKKQRRGTWRRRFSRGSLKIPTSIAFPTAAVGNMASSVRRGSSRLRQSFKDRMSITLTGDGPPGQQSTADAIAAAAGSFHDLDEEDDDDDSDVDSQKQERMKSKEELEKQAAQASKEKGQQQPGGLPSAAGAAGNMMNNIRASGRNLRASFVSKMNKEAEPATTGGGDGEQAPNPEEKKAMLTLRSSFKQMSSALSEKAANIPKAIRRGSVNPKMNIILTSTALLDPSPHYVGNNRFKISLEMYRDEFLRTSTSPERQEQIAASLVDTVYINWKGRFVKVFIVASVEEDETEEQMEQHELSRDQAIEVTMKLLSINSTAAAVPPVPTGPVPPAAVNTTASNPEMTSKQQQQQQPPPQVVQPAASSTPAAATRPVIPPVINPASFQLQIPEDMQKMRNAAIRDLKEKKQKKDILSRIAQQNRRGGPAVVNSNQHLQQQQLQQQQQYQQQQLQYQQQQQQQQQNNMMPAALRGFGGFNFSNFTGGGGGGNG